LDFGLEFSEQHRHFGQLESEENDLYCPQCKSEYRRGFDQCADCAVPLVYELPQESTPAPLSGPDADLVPVFSTYNPAEVMMVKSLLDAEGVVYNFQGELFKGSGVFIVPAMLFVAKADAQRVADILEDHGMG
jgi:hypothetical protein